MFQDIRYGVRMLTRTPVVTAIAVITLALGIGANTAIFSVVHGVLLAPLPYPEPDRLVALRQSNVPAQPDTQISPGNFLEWQRQSTAFSNLAAYRTVSYNLTGEGNPERLLAGRVSAGLFKLRRATDSRSRFSRRRRSTGTRKGRPHRRGSVAAALRFRSNHHRHDVETRRRRLRYHRRDAGGVSPARSTRARTVDSDRFQRQRKNAFYARYIDAIARLKPEASFAHAQSEMTAIAARLAQEHPDANTGWTINVTPLLDFVVGDVKTILWLLFGAVAVVLRSRVQTLRTSYSHAPPRDRKRWPCAQRSAPDAGASSGN